ncbi:tripartite motif-containing protein 16-like [Colossoma macropomum]|uniref:tripartite motif-containing protein 16-like n=1 Tax=Colossoma macropomum TaxID=42526 RepID=UPI001863D2F4|nr:tripartite motif-containing protein 16-like [Colossoma macropomum]
MYGLSEHSLAIETGRGRQTWLPREARLCSHCELSVVEMELHFLTECPRYVSIRKEFYKKVSSVCPEFELCSDSEKLAYVLGGKSELITHAARYVTACHNLRDDHMSESVTEACQDYLNCSVCLNILMDPVTIPCGHSYCMECIKECWDEEELQKKAYSCPQCRGRFPTRPVLNRSTVLTDVLRGLKSPADMQVKLNGGECNFCSGEKRRAVKSCLTCVASFCETHLKTHLEFPVLQRHTLVEPCSRLQEMLCPLHNKLLDVYCVRDKRCICLLCAMDEHSDHKTVSAAKEWSEQRQKPLQNLQERFPRLLQRREKELQALNKAVKTYSTSAQAAVELNESFLAEITQSMEKKLSQTSNLIQVYEKKELCQAEGLQKKLEQTVARLKLSDAECDQLGHTDQHILCLQEFLSLSAFSETESLQSNPVKENPSFLNAAGLLSGLKEQLEKLFDKKMNEMTSAAIKLKIVLPANPKTRQEFQEHFCQLKLSPESSHASLKLSEENRKVEHSSSSSYSRVQPNAERFTSLYQVLCDSPVKGCCYWEVMRSGTVHIALSYGSIPRNSGYSDSKFGYNNQSWSLECYDNKCTFWHNGNATELSAWYLSKIGVYLDEGAGMLAFYQISSNSEMTLLHKAQVELTKPVYPGFRLERGSSVTLC